MRIGITGSNGYVGSILKETMISSGNLVYDMNRNCNDENKNEINFTLGKSTNSDKLSVLDCIIHCAYDFNPYKWDDIYRINVEGSIRLFEEAFKCGVKKIIYISSMSAYEQCKSLYGKAKYLIEQYLKDSNAIILRPGLVFGGTSGGMFGKLENIIDKFPIIPVISSHKELILYLVYERDLAELVIRLCKENEVNIDSPIIAAHPDGKTFKAILAQLAEVKKLNRLFIPIPWQFPWLLLKLSEIMSIKLPFKSDSLLSLLNQEKFPDFSNGAVLGVTYSEFKQIMADQKPDSLL